MILEAVRVLSTRSRCSATHCPFCSQPAAMPNSSQCSHLTGTWHKSRHRGSAVLAVMMLAAAWPNVLFTPSDACHEPANTTVFLPRAAWLCLSKKEPECIETGSPNTSESCYNQSSNSPQCRNAFSLSPGVSEFRSPV